MLMDFLKSLNWVDILLLVVCARAVFIGIKTGFIVEFFKTIGLLFSIFITLHYYSVITGMVVPYVTLFQPVSIQIFVFLTLWLLVTLVFMFVRDGSMILFSVQAHPKFDQIGGGCLGFLRGILVCGMTLFVLLLTYNENVVKVAEKSFSRHIVADLPTGIYKTIYQGFVIKFFPLEAINQDAVEIPRLLDQKSK